MVSLKSCFFKEESRKAKTPLLFKEGWTRPQENGSVHLNGADGVVRNFFTTPSAPLRKLRNIFLMAQPPLLKKGGESYTT